MAGLQHLLKRVIRTPAAAQFVWFPLPATGRRAIRGESYHQKELRSVTRGMRLPTVRGDNWDASVSMTATLQAEPQNRHDPFAVRVEILGRPVGHLPAEDAPDYQPLLLQLAEQGKVGTCEARLMIEPRSENMAVYLHLGPPDDVAFAIEAPGYCAPILGERTVTVTGEEAYQDVLHRFAPKRLGDERRATAVLGFCTIAKGKYVGQQAIEVRLGSERVGQLTRAMTEQYERLVSDALSAGKTPVCRAMISRSPSRGVQVELLMPR